MDAIVETSNHVDLRETTIGGKSYLQFDFIGHLSHSSALKAISQWKNCMKPGTKINLVYNCTSMTGFDTEARKAWQSTMVALKNEIGNIWIISTNVFILGAAKTMGLLTGFSIKAAKSLADIK